MDIYLPDESNIEIWGALRAGKRVLIDAEITIDNPESSSPELTLIINAFKAVLDNNQSIVRSTTIDFDNLSTVGELLLMDRLDFKWDFKAYSSIAEAFFGNAPPSQVSAQRTLTPSDIFYGHYMPKWGPGIQPVRTGLEKLTNNSLLFSEPPHQRRPGAKRHFSPNPASFTIWEKLIDRYKARAHEVS